MDAQPALHPTDQTLHAYGLGKLDEASAESVNAHLEGCPDCRQRVAALSADSFLGRLRNAKAEPEAFRPAVSSTDGFSVLATGPAPARRPRPAPCHRAWPTSRTTKSFVNWARAAWASSSSPGTR